MPSNVSSFSIFVHCFTFFHVTISLSCFHFTISLDRSSESTVTGDCTSRVYGCCPDGVTAARGPNMEGCVDTVDSGTASLCQRSRFGCCPDGVTAAEGPNRKGCEADGGLTIDRGREGSGCKGSRYGCCPDGVTVAQGPSQQGCKTEVMVKRKCEQSYYGCCPNSSQAATGPNNQGCPGTATTTAFDPGKCVGVCVCGYISESYIYCVC